MTLGNFLKKNESIETMARYLDGLDHPSRIQEIQVLSARELAKLYGIALKNIGMEDLLPKKFTPLQPIIFYGKNSLPALNIFQKRMCRSKDGSHILGYNHQTFQWATGPGYFVIKNETEKPGEVMVDYTQLPESKPATWPQLKSNNSGLGKLVYGSMKDFLRRVSRDIFIGIATKKGKPIGQYFILCREPVG